MNYTLIRDESTLSVQPCDETVKKFLTITEKKMVVNGWQKQTVRQKVPFYRMSDDVEDTCITYQGIWKSLKEHLEKLGNVVTHVDKRRNFPELRLTGIRGLRFSQHPLLLQALMQNNSGLIGAPTRAI